MSELHRCQDFDKVVENCVAEIQKMFREGLEEKCRLGAISAASAALDTSDTFAASMHWATYRASTSSITASPAS